MNDNFHGWLNIYKPKGISSAKIVAIVKKSFSDKKIGHAGTLDVEAEGVLPIAVGEATKLVQFLIETKKTYVFTIQFGAQTDSGDFSGKIIKTVNNIPTKQACVDIIHQFIGPITQIPNAYSAIKVGGVRSYKLAREGNLMVLPKRVIVIYDLELLDFDQQNNRATYVANCSKGTYIRTLAEDIALSLQSLGFVIELRRTKVGIFSAENSFNIEKIANESIDIMLKTFEQNMIRIEAILDDISVIVATDSQAKQIKFGQKCFFEKNQDTDLIWIKYQETLLATGSIKDNCFNSSRVFNLI